jgi:hypothetical protein
MEGNESFDASCLGEAEEVVEKRVADDAMVSSAALHVYVLLLRVVQVVYKHMWLCLCCWSFSAHVCCAVFEGNESFDASCLGEAEEVVEKRVADDAMVSVSCPALVYVLVPWAYYYNAQAGVVVPVLAGAAGGTGLDSIKDALVDAVDIRWRASRDSSCLGEAEEVVEKRLADDAMVSSSVRMLVHVACDK